MSGAGETGPTPIDGPADRYLDGQYATDNAGWHDEDAAWKAGKILELLRANHVVPASVCDIGCGTGGVLAGLAPGLPGAAFTGFELSPQAVALAGRLHPEIEVRHGSALDAAAEGARFDLAVMCDVFEHVDDYLGFLGRTRALARHHVFHIPLDMSALGVLRQRPILQARSTLGHLHYFSAGTAVATLEGLGYRVIDSRYTAGAVELTAPSLKRRVASVPRRAVAALSPAFAARALGGYSLLVLAEAD